MVRGLIEVIVRSDTMIQSLAWSLQTFINEKMTRNQQILHMVKINIEGHIYQNLRIHGQ